MTSKSPRPLFAAVLALTLAATACTTRGSSSSSSSGGSAQGTPTSIDAACQAGAKEGSMILASTGTPESNAQITEEFNKKYPAIKVKYVTLRPSDITQRVLTESQAGRNASMDVLYEQLDYVGPLDDHKVLDTSIDWKSLGVRPTAISPDDMVRTNRDAIGIIYNKNKVNAADLPSTWDDLLTKSQWKGKVVVDPRGDPLSLLALAWGKDKTLGYVNQLKADLSPQVIKGSTAGALTVASGENLVTTSGHLTTYAEQAAKGAPLAIKYLDIVPVADYYAAIPKGAPHRNAAICWAYWANSPEGSAAYYKYAYDANDDIPQGAPSNAKIASIKSAADATMVADTAAEITKVWGGSS